MEAVVKSKPVAVKVLNWISGILVAVAVVIALSPSWERSGDAALHGATKALTSLLLGGAIAWALAWLVTFKFGQRTQAFARVLVAVLMLLAATGSVLRSERADRTGGERAFIEALLELKGKQETEMTALGEKLDSAGYQALTLDKALLTREANLTGQKEVSEYIALLIERREKYQAHINEMRAFLADTQYPSRSREMALANFDEATADHAKAMEDLYNAQRTAAGMVKMILMWAVEENLQVTEDGTWNFKTDAQRERSKVLIGALVDAEKTRDEVEKRVSRMFSELEEGNKLAGEAARAALSK